MSRFYFRPDRFWLTRHYIALSTLSSMVIGIASPGSLNARALQASGWYGWAVLAALSTVAGLLLIEAFTTAFVKGTQINGLRNRRHSLLMALALGNLCVGFLIVNFAPTSGALVVRFGLDASMAALVAFLDLFQRHRIDRCYP